MKVEYVEKYDIIKDMKPGDIAVSKDRKKMYLCCWVPNREKTDCHVAVVELTNTTDQYIHKLEFNQWIRILRPGDRFLIER